jgi:predicted esterase YcpF (UPF0227 family)
MKRSSVRASLTTCATRFAASVNRNESHFREDARLHRLHHQNALQHAAIDERNSQERVVIILARLAEVLEARMILDLFHGHRADLFRDQAGQSLH